MSETTHIDPEFHTMVLLGIMCNVHAGDGALLEKIRATYEGCFEESAV